MVRRFFPVGVVALVVAGPAFGQSANTGVNFLASSSTESGFVPPDTNGAVGPNHVVMPANGRYKMFDKLGTLAAGTSQTMDSFWTNRAGLSTSSSFDPRVVYDRQSGRWFASANDNQQSANSNTLLAASPGTDPTAASWFGVKQRMDTTGTRWADFNQLAVGPTWVAVTNNMFAVSSGTATVSLITVPKANLAAGTSAGESYQQNLNPNTFGFTPHPVTDAFGENATTQYTLSALSSGTTLRLGTISGSNDGPTYAGQSTITVGSAFAPPDAPQMGSPMPVATSDNRFSSQPVLANGKLWAVHNVSSGGVAAIRWYRINPTAGTLEASGTLPAPAGLYLYFPSIAVNQAGDIVIGYSGSSTTTFPSTYYSVGQFDGTNTTFGNPVLSFAGSGAITSFNGRFGDYSATTFDPADPGIFWTFQEYGTPGSSWRTQATEVIPSRLGEVRWATAAAGDASVPANWFSLSPASPPVVPLPTDHVIFSRWSPSSYTVTIPSAPPIIYDRLSVRQTGPGTVTFALATGASLTLTNTGTATPSLAVSEFQGTSTVSFTGGIVSAQTVVVSGFSFGAGTLRVENGATLNVAGDLHLGGTATAAGGTGTLVVDGSSAMAAVSVAGNLNFWQTSASATVSASANSATLTAGGLTSQTGVPTLTLAHPTTALVLNGAGTTSFGGVIAGPGAVSKTGTGTQTLTGTNTYSGSTTVSGGTLALSGTGSLASSPMITVGAGAILDGSGVAGGSNHDGARFALANGQTLKGNGTVTGPLGVRPGSTLAPGSSPGKLTVSGGLVFTGGTLTIQVTGPTPGTEHSQVEVTGGAIDLGSGVATLSLPSPGGSFTPTSEIVFLHASGSATYVGGKFFAGLPNGAAVPELAGLGGQANWYINYGVAPGSGLSAGNDVLVTPVPEPGAMLVVAAGVIAGWRTRRHRTACV